MTSTIDTTATRIAKAVFDAKHGRRFDRAVREFVRVLRTVPDYAPAQISAGAVRLLQQLAESVIAQIEQRLERSVDQQSLQTDLAQGVYEIRSALEEIDRWQRHYAVR